MFNNKYKKINWFSFRQEIFVLICRLLATGLNICLKYLLIPTFAIYADVYFQFFIQAYSSVSNILVRKIYWLVSNINL